MIKYLAEPVERYNKIINGISINEELWKSFNITTETLEDRIRKTESIGSEIELLKKNLSDKLSEARVLRDAGKRVAEALKKGLRDYTPIMKKSSQNME